RKLKYARAVRDNGGDPDRPGYAPEFLPVIYELPRDEAYAIHKRNGKQVYGWELESNWWKANPNLGVTIPVEAMREECRKAKEDPSQLNSFLRLNLNVVTDADEGAIDMGKWDQCGDDVDPIAWRAKRLEELRGEPCYGGLDLGSSSDLTAFVLVFGDGEDGYEILPWFWVPEDSALSRQHKDKVPYVTWIEQGFVESTSDDWTNYNEVARMIGKLASEYAIRNVAIDRAFQGDQMMQVLREEHGIDVVPMGAGTLTQTAPTKRWLDLIHTGRLAHGNNPVMRWQAGNLVVWRDESGGMKPNKKKSTEKIDGQAAAIMALACAMVAENAGPSMLRTIRRQRSFLGKTVSVKGDANGTAAQHHPADRCEPFQ
ncbi:hypothetical protein LCGC14_2790460, partial [marine sediment metagenome]